MALYDQQSRDSAFDGRRERRKTFRSHRALVAQCHTIDAQFSDRVQNLSASGVFLETARDLILGQEIAMVIPLPNSPFVIKATGVVVRKTRRGFGVAFTIVFHY